MESLFISNEDGSLRAETVPASGGMIGQIYLGNQELLHVDRVLLEKAPMAAGGAPILFPFSSRTANDSYVLNDKEYHMPMHGLVKNDIFSVAVAEKDRVIFWTENSASWKDRYYPFDFRLEVEYRIIGKKLETIFRITNKSQEPMPHYLGWHPFFQSADKKETALTHDMTVHYDYMENKDLPVCGIDDLSKYWDDVFHTPEKGRFTFINRKDGYKVDCETDAIFDTLVLCTLIEDSVCVEPWCGLPNSINTGKLLKWIPPMETVECKVTLTFEKI